MRGRVMSAGPRRRLAWALVGPFALLATGCLQYHSTIHVNRDGTGTVEQELIFGHMLVSMLGSEFMPTDEQQLAQDAEKMGRGVRLIDVEPITDERGQGHRATYAFDDVNQLNINQNPSANVPQPDSGEAVVENVRFELRRGSPAVLTVWLPVPDEDDFGARGGGGDGDAASGQAPEGEMLELVRQLYAEMSMSMAIEVDGRILSSTATHVDGSRVTVMELDFARVVDDEERFMELISSNPNTVAATTAALADMDGIRVELQPSIEIRF